MSVSIGNQLYETLEKGKKLYYFHEDIWKRFDHEAASNAVLEDKADYVLEIIKHPATFKFQDISIEATRRTAHIEYNFVPAYIGDEN